MPDRDGTGPCGRGPGTGRGWKKWSTFSFFADRPGRIRVTFYAVVVPFIGAIIRDIMNPDGVIRLIAGKLFRNTRSLPKNKEVNATYRIISEDTTDEQK
jgi:hypothetical protein